LRSVQIQICENRAILTLILLTLFSLISINDFQPSTFCVKGYIRSEFVHHDPIVILNDNDFKTQNWPGDGTIENPYIIEGLNITTNEICIRIYSTSLHFIIRDCFLRSLQGGYMCCIQFHEVANGAVVGCEIDSGYMYSKLIGDVIETHYGLELEFNRLIHVTSLAILSLIITMLSVSKIQLHAFWRTTKSVSLGKESP